MCRDVSRYAQVVALQASGGRRPAEKTASDAPSWTTVPEQPDMSTKKKPARKKKNKVPPYLKAIVKFVLGRGRSLVLSLLVVGAFVGAWRVTWVSVRENVVASPQYWLTADQIEITPRPEWIHTDIRAEALQIAGLEGPLSILDQNLVERAAKAFSFHPWVAEVRRVRKRHPAGLGVDLVYRRPVCMVVVRDGMLPVDIEGILPPGRANFPPGEAMQYPRLLGVETTPTGHGTRWRDVRVVEGAEIAAAFGALWQELRLDHIEPYVEPNSESVGDYNYHLITSGGSLINWGRAPGNAMPGEAPASEKIALLKNYFQKHGTLDGRNGARPLDLRDLRRSAHSASTGKQPIR